MWGEYVCSMKSSPSKIGSSLSNHNLKVTLESTGVYSSLYLITKIIINRKNHPHPAWLCNHRVLSNSSLKDGQKFSLMVKTQINFSFLYPVV